MTNAALRGKCIVLAAAFGLATATTGLAAGLERAADKDGVEVKAAPVNAGSEEAATLDFSVTMDTHAGALPPDMKKIAAVRGPSGVSVRAIAWKGGAGGHHLTGTLSFPSGMTRYEGPLSLIFEGAGGNDLVLVWKEPLVAGLGVTRVKVDGGSYLDIPPSVLARRLPGKDFYLVNVHVPYEGEIAGTDAFIPYDQTERRVSEYPKDKAATILLYCRSGMMSDVAARVLVRLGYVNVVNLAGGMNAWVAARNPLSVEPAKR